MATREERLRRFRFLELKQKAARQAPAKTPLLPEVDFGAVTPERAARTEQLIAERRPAIETFREEIETPFRGGLISRAAKIPTLALKGAAVPLERAEAAIAGPLAELQTTVGQPIPTTIARAARAAIKGLTGERRIQLGDIPRRAGFGEALSSGIGLGSTIKLIDIPAQKAITKSISRVGKGIKNIVVGDKRAVFNGVKDFVGGLDDTLREAGNNVGKMFDGNIGKKVVNQGEFIKITQALPDNILRKLRRTENVRLFGIKFGKLKRRGKPILTKKVVWNVRRFLDDLLTPKEFAEGTTKVAKDAIFLARTKLKLLLEKGDDAIKPVMDTFSSLTDDFSFAKTTLTTKGRPVVNKFLRALKGQGELELQDTLKALAQFVPRAQKTINQAVRFNRAQLARKLVAGAAAATGAGILFRRPLTRAIEGIGGGGGAIPTTSQ